MQMDAEHLSNTPPTPFSISDRAAMRIAYLLQKQAENSFFRISVEGGGCSGYQYHFVFDATITGDDITIEKEGATLVIDEISLGLLAGSQMDYEEDLMGSMFVIKNPNATSRCGCGNSFAI
jgi:iron-sulfur cluster insertion protein